ncbi:hypothetical protein [Fictibacillus barbaricus]|uniref:Uncharacterized protein n=1 Tax=Fictibacillus barbaricus TaxID=182136 RepID=A0ABU1U5L0_9BACL|nr:hypothetical protein [Fictibacillus barbaricus]MDR7074750.1 hypothetical protein [Fictibacillus barbaricus]
MSLLQEADETKKDSLKKAVDINMLAVVSYKSRQNERQRKTSSLKTEQKK